MKYCTQEDTPDTGLAAEPQWAPPPRQMELAPPGAAEFVICDHTIEEYHKAIKTGLGAERLQLESVERLFAAIAIMSVVALRLIELRERLRRHPDAEAAQSGLSPLELEVLRARSGRRLQTVREVALAIGRLGGHLNRIRDGLPGWQTLWHGMNTLHALVEGVLIAPRLQSFG